jgi:MoaA/NifB/PqqE/SkfB family radical SAM enzyme
MMQIAKLKMNHTYEIIDTGDSNVPTDYHVTFRLGDKCNLECEYCRWYDGDNYRFPLECIENIFEFFKEKNFKTVLFYFHGGEAGIHPLLIKSLEKLREKEKETGIRTIIELQTNLSYTLRRLENVYKLIDNISISYHYIELTKKTLHTAFVNNLNWIMDNNKPINRFDVMLDDVPFDELDAFYARVKGWLEYPGIVDSEMIHSFCHYEKNPVTKRKHIEFYNAHNKTEQLYKVDGKQYSTNDLFAEGLNCKGQLCDAGSKFMVLNADGNVFTCGIEMTFYRMECGQPVKPITNVVTDPNYMKILNIRYKTKIRCKYDYCGGDFYIPKYGDEQ